MSVVSTVAEGGFRRIPPRERVRVMIHWAYKRLAIAAGVLIMVISVPIGFMTPFIPVGLPLMLVGAMIVLANSATAKRQFVHWRRRYPVTGRRLRNLMRKLTRRT